MDKNRVEAERVLTKKKQQRRMVNPTKKNGKLPGRSRGGKATRIKRY
jgi:hypothetical protein